MGELSSQSLSSNLIFHWWFGKVCVQPRITSSDRPSRQRPAGFSQGSGGRPQGLSLYFSSAVAEMQGSGPEWVLQTMSRSPPDAISASSLQLSEGTLGAFEWKSCREDIPQHPSEAPVPLRDQWLLRNPSLSFFLNIILFLYVCDGPWLLLRLFSSCGGQGPLHICSAQASPCSGFSCCGARALGHTDFRSCGTRAQWSQFPGSRAQDQQSWCTG